MNCYIFYNYKLLQFIHINTIIDNVRKKNLVIDFTFLFQNKEKYKGSIADVSGVIRIAVTNRQNTPDIYSIMNVLGIEEVKRRLRLAIDRM